MLKMWVSRASVGATVLGLASEVLAFMLLLRSADSRSAWVSLLLLGDFALTCTGACLLSRLILQHPRFPVLSGDDLSTLARAADVEFRIIRLGGAGLRVVAGLLMVWLGGELAVAGTVMAALTVAVQCLGVVSGALRKGHSRATRSRVHHDG